ncbi:hypothetical protein B566_EDAN010725 [Ephemera danica]|nr:hypothetical protein B566_EDAN010725 [Ephemera danica]
MMTRYLQLALVLVATVAVCLANTVTESDVQLDAPGTDGRVPPSLSGTIGSATMNQMANLTRGMARDMRMKGGPNLNSNGDLNYAAIESQFLYVSNATWQPLVKTAINNCTTQLRASSGTSPTSAPGTKNCPAALKVQGKTCSRDLTTLATCNPMSAPTLPLKNMRQPLNSNGDLNYAAIESQFLYVSNATWQPLVKTAINNCTTQLRASSGTSPTSAPGTKNCPAALKVQGKTCSRDLTTLATCNPMSAPTLPLKNMRQPVIA